MEPPLPSRQYRLEDFSRRKRLREWAWLSQVRVRRGACTPLSMNPSQDAMASQRGGFLGFLLPRVRCRNFRKKREANLHL